MTISIKTPSDYTYNGQLPCGTMLFAGRKYTVCITLDKEYPTFSVKNMHTGVTRTKEAKRELAKFGLVDIERYTPKEPHTAAYFMPKPRT